MSENNNTNYNSFNHKAGGGLAGAIGGNTGGGLQSSPNVPVPGTSINPETGKPHTAGLTRAELAAKKEAEKVQGQTEQAEIRTSFSDDIGRAFDDIGLSHNKTPEIQQTATFASGGGGRGGKPASPHVDAERTPDKSGTVAHETGASGSVPLESASVIPQGDVQAISLDGDTTVFFIDDGAEFPEIKEDVDGSRGEALGGTQDTRSVGEAGFASNQPAPGVGRGDEAAGSHSQSGTGGVGAAGLGAAAGAGAGAVGLGAASLASRDGPQSTEALSNGSTQQVPTTNGGNPLYGQPVPPISVDEVDSEHSKLPLAPIAGGAGGAALGTALSHTSDTRLGPERADSSASITAIHGGSEGKAQHPENENSPSLNQNKPNLSLGDLPPRPHDDEYPLGSPDLPVTSSTALGVPTSTKRGFDPAASTASITAIRSGNEGNTPSPSTGTSGYSHSPLSQTVTAPEGAAATEDGLAVDTVSDAVSDRTIPATSAASIPDNSLAAQAASGGQGQDSTHAGVAGAGVGAAAGAGAGAAVAGAHSETRDEGEDGSRTPTSGFRTAEGGATPALSEHGLSKEGSPEAGAGDGVSSKATPENGGPTTAAAASTTPTTRPTAGSKGHQRTVSSSSSARRRKVSILHKLKGEMKVLSGRISNDDKKVAEGERMRSGE